MKKKKLYIYYNIFINEKIFYRQNMKENNNKNKKKRDEK